MPPLIGRALFGAGLAAAIWGWGELASASFARSGGPRPAVSRAALGLAVVLAVGAALNALHLAVPWAYAALLLAGWTGAILALRRADGDVLRRQLLPAALVLAALLPLFLTALDSDKFNPSDDCYSYLVGPARIVALGTRQPDPFNYRNFISGPGGMAFLQAPLMELFGVNAVRMADQGSGLLLLVATALAFLRRRGVAPLLAVPLVAAAVLVPEHALVNVTSHFTLLALLLGLLDLLTGPAEPALARAASAGFLLAGLAALKHTALPFAGLACLFAALETARRNPRLAGRQSVIAAALAGVVTLAWHLPDFQVTTRLIPLGRGDGSDDVHVGDMIRWVASGDAWNWIYLVVFVVAFTGFLAVIAEPAVRIQVAAVAVAALAGNAVMIYLTGGTATSRYAEPVFLAAYLAGAGLALGARAPGIGRGALAVAVGLGFLAFRYPQPTGSGIPEFAFNRVAGYGDIGSGQPWANYAALYASSVAHAATGRPVDYPAAADLATARRLQAAMAPGATVLVRLDRPFLLDFSRNRIFVADYADACAPAGMPIGSTDPQAWASYFRGLSIRYVAYAYGTEAGFPAAPLARRLAHPRFTPWQRAIIRHVPDFHRALLALGAAFPKVYDDGTTMVIDLDAIPGPRP